MSKKNPPMAMPRRIQFYSNHEKIEKSNCHKKLFFAASYFGQVLVAIL